LFVASFVVLWDSGYVLSRPTSMRGGSMYWLWAPYDFYATDVDRRYGDISDGFVIAQSQLNIAEAALSFSALFMSNAGSPATLPTTLVASVLTCAKTVLYFLVEWNSGLQYTKHATPFNFFFYGVFLNGLWIVVPAIIATWSWRKIAAQLAQRPRQKAA